MEAIIGVDIGQKVDPTAIVVVQPEWREDVIHFLVRHLERLPLRTTYPAVADRLVNLQTAIDKDNKEARCTFWVDATGVGQPVVDLLRSKKLKIKAVYITGGDRRREETDALYLPKALLVSRLQVLLQSERIHLPKTVEAEALAKELLDYEIHVSDDGADTYGAFKTGAHDDLVTALGLACWEEPRKPLDPLTREMFRRASFYTPIFESF